MTHNKKYNKKNGNRKTVKGLAAYWLRRAFCSRSIQPADGRLPALHGR